ncbi:MAG: hypothetical protein GXY83_36670 [Rhodopirellula sp.]|nr:hypothetical protein [Rhodopirellula sp.]
MRVPLVVLWAAMAMPVAGRAAEMAYNENFIVLATDKTAAEAVLAEANRFRDELAREWFGEELPASVGRTTINVELAEGENRAFTWPAGGEGRRYHKIWLTTSRAEATGNTLRHEVVHVVLHTGCPGVLPAWADEGIASLYDDANRVEIRRKILAWYAKSGAWPELAPILAAEQIPADDQAGYSVAASLARYLLSRRDKATLLDFAAAGKRDGWDLALKTHYGIADVAELQRNWQQWAGQQQPLTSRLSARQSGYGVQTQPNSGS